MVRIIISGFKSFDEQITSTRGQYFSGNLVYQAYMHTCRIWNLLARFPNCQKQVGWGPGIYRLWSLVPLHLYCPTEYTFK